MEILVKQISSSFVVLNGATQRYIEIMPLKPLTYGSTYTMFDLKGRKVKGKIINPKNMMELKNAYIKPGTQIVDTLV